ncbi:winged helix-turn-helix transcriptional regulator [Flavobacterium hercynium]|uniref:Transcriptional regulator n=1 Tax=Flavobacterium hercynium TaxID=387094 RepID=A0A226HIT1_9FLAO|nr:helix-turn-helix domain-containing protein [Flavobacterium hercynium]OXA93778.1 transcriptional regulator [Flavobacterium hercynium]SMP20430.1 transcriptional regulator, HxlR family [Flavobacterium hercynium]
MRKESSTNFENQQTLTDFCNASKTLQLISGRWKLSLLFSLLEHDRRSFSNFKQLLPAISDRMLALHLKQMTDDLLITKEKIEDGVFYTLTEKGKSLKKILSNLAEWQI